MNAAARLAVFGAGLAVVFVAAYGIAAAVVPDTAATAHQDLDFKVDGTVHTATFVADAARGDGNPPARESSHGGGH